MITNTGSSIFKYQATAILVMLVGWGWIAGNFAAPFDTFWIGAVTAIGHCIPIVLLLIFGLQFFRTHDAGQQKASSSQWGQVGVTILAIIAIIGCIVLVSLGASNPNPNAVGVKSPGDWFPTIILFVSALLWLTVLISSRQRNAEVKMTSKK